MRKLAVLAFALIIITSFAFPRPTLASPGLFSLSDFFSDWFFPTPPQRHSFPRRTPRSIPVASFVEATPTPTPEPSQTPSLSNRSTPTPSPGASTDIRRDYIMNQINTYRKSLGLSEVQTDPYTCNFATTRAKEISTGFNHDGFNNRLNNHTLPYPGYYTITENIAETSNYQQVETLWQNSPGHAENMRADTPYVCVESFGNDYAYEGWKP
jgi:uncharacterized protein YkwD